MAELPLPPFPYEMDFFGSPFPKEGDIMTKTQHFGRVVQERQRGFGLKYRKSRGALWSELQRAGRDRAWRFKSEAVEYFEHFGSSWY